MKPHVLPVLAVVLLAQSLVGCARYRYAIVEPVEEARLVPEEGEMMLDRPPLKYVFADLDERLGLAVINDTNELIRLREGRSYVVDPEGETHPLPGRIIAPNSHVLLYVPPVRPRYRGYASPAYGGYYGGYYGARYYHGFGYYDPWYHPRPYYYETLAPATIYDWSWGRGQVRVHLAYEVVPAEEAPRTGEADADAPTTRPGVAGETFMHEFVLVRAKEDELVEGRAPYLANRAVLTTAPAHPR